MQAIAILRMTFTICEPPMSPILKYIIKNVITNEIVYVKDVAKAIPIMVKLEIRNSTNPSSDH